MSGPAGSSVLACRNAVIAVETIWLPSDLGVLIIAVFWFVPTVVLLVVSSVRLMQLFGHPSRLDEVVRSALVEALGERLEVVATRYASAGAQLGGPHSPRDPPVDAVPNGFPARACPASRPGDQVGKAAHRQMGHGHPRTTGHRKRR